MAWRAAGLRTRGTAAALDAGEADHAGQSMGLVIDTSALASIERASASWMRRWRPGDRLPLPAIVCRFLVGVHLAGTATEPTRQDPGAAVKAARRRVHVCDRWQWAGCLPPLAVAPHPRQRSAVAATARHLGFGVVSVHETKPIFGRCLASASRSSERSCAPASDVGAAMMQPGGTMFPYRDENKTQRTHHRRRSSR
jgi:hypothetical protein